MNPRRRRHNKRARRLRDVLLALLGVPIEGGHPGYQAYIRKRQAIVHRAVRESQEYMMYLLTRGTPKIEVTSPDGYTRHIQATITFER